jgi:hypothetical protein
MIRKVLFLIRNRHFLIRKRHFDVSGCRYVGGVAGSGTTSPFLPQEFFKMIRRLLAASIVVAAVVLTACSDMTAPKHTTCPVTNGSSTCLVAH